MSDLVPYRIFISQETIERLNEAATSTKRESGNKVAASVVTECLDVWLTLQESLEAHRGEFLQGVIAAIQSGQAPRKR